MKFENSDTNQIKRIIEAVLFAAGHPMSYNKLASVTGIPSYDVKKVVKEMTEIYDDPERMSGITLLMFENECQLCTRSEFEPYIREALDIKKGGNLSASSLEVLAVIAYNEPVTRSFVDTVRGVDSAYIVSRLADKGLIESCGRLDVPGRPLLYKTTDVFLRCFGLDSLKSLPKVDIPKPAETEEAVGKAE